MGTSAFAVPILKRIIESDYRLAGVVTRCDEPRGRGLETCSSPVKEFLLKNAPDTPLVQPKNLKEGSAVNSIQRLKGDLIVVAAYGMYLPPAVLRIARYGCLNVHPSLLPKYRGPSPIQTAIINQDAETGTTIMLMDEGMDTGAIISQTRVAIPLKASAPGLEEELAAASSELLLKTIPGYISGDIIPSPQDNNAATYTKLISKKDGHINWTEPAETIEARLRAYQPWPGIYSFFESKNKRIKISMINAKVSAKETEKDPGKVLIRKILGKKQIVISTGRGLFLIEKIKPEGKNVMSPLDFINGHPDFIGTTLK